jgi:hypothetical protein
MNILRISERDDHTKDIYPNESSFKSKMSELSHIGDYSGVKQKLTGMSDGEQKLDGLVHNVSRDKRKEICLMSASTHYKRVAKMKQGNPNRWQLRI